MSGLWLRGLTRTSNFVSWARDHFLKPNNFQNIKTSHKHHIYRGQSSWGGLVELRLHHIHQKIKHHGITALTLGGRGILLILVPGMSLKMTQKEKPVFKTLPWTKLNPLHTQRSWLTGASRVPEKVVWTLLTNSLPLECSKNSHLGAAKLKYISTG